MFLSGKGDKSEKKENVHVLIELWMESAATFWLMILQGIISLASHRKLGLGTMENKLKDNHPWLTAYSG